MIATGVEFALTALSRGWKIFQASRTTRLRPGVSACRRRPRPNTRPSSPRRHLDPAVGAKKLFWTPYVFAQCGAYSRGRPNG